MTANLNKEKTISEILCSSSLLGWITASDISHSWKQNTIIMFFHHSARLTCAEQAIDSLCFLVTIITIITITITSLSPVWCHW